MKNKKIGKKGAAVTGVAVIAVLAALFGTGKLGFGSGIGLGESEGETGKADSSIVETVSDTQENPENASDTESARIEIRIQGREYNYENVTYGNTEHPMEELLKALKEFPPETRIELIVEDNATKNAVDDLENALTAAGFNNIHK